MVGLVAGLIAAFLWAVAVFIFRRQCFLISPLKLNFFKVAIAFIVLLIILTVKGFGGLMPVYHWASLLFFFSGVVGIGLGDTAFFYALNHMGAQKTITVCETLPPVLTLFMAVIFFQQTISVFSILGLLLVIIGTGKTVISAQSLPEKSAEIISPFNIGLVWALFASLCIASGSIISKLAFRLYSISPEVSVLYRLCGGLCVLLIIVFITERRTVLHWRLAFIRQRDILKNSLWVVVASLIGTLGGIFFMQISLKYVDVSLAQCMFATSPVFLLLIECFRGRLVRLNAWLGVMLAVFGVAVVFLSF